MLRPFASCIAAFAIMTSHATAKPREGLKGRIILPHNAKLCAIDSGSSEEMFGAILAAVLPGLIEAGVKGLGNALAKAAGPKETKVSARKSDYFYGTGSTGFPLITQHSCMAFVVDSSVAVKGELPFIADTTAGLTTYSGVKDKLSIFDIRLLSDEGYRRYPLFYAMFRVETAADKSAWRMVPTSVWTGPALDDSKLGRDGRDLVLVPSVEGSSASDDTNLLAHQKINIKRVEFNGWIQDKDKLEQLATGWIPFPPLANIAKERRDVAVKRQEAIAAIEAILENKRTAAQKTQLTKMSGEVTADIDAMAQLLPVRFGFDLFETRDGNRFLQKAGEFLAGNAGAIAKPIAAEFDSDAKLAKATATSTAVTGLQVAAIESIDAWESAVADPTKNDAQRRVLKLKAQLACSTLRANGLDDIACGRAD